MKIAILCLLGALAGCGQEPVGEAKTSLGGGPKNARKVVSALDKMLKKKPMSAISTRKLEKLYRKGNISFEDERDIWYVLSRRYKEKSKK